MALMVDDSGFKYFCKICKKGFGCGQALGGHMRAHDENSLISDEETSSGWDDNLDDGNKHVYALRENPNRLKSFRVCQNCGEEFFSWKSFLQHGKCGSEDAESLESEGENRRRSCGWSKRKRSVRTEVENYGPNSEEEDLANCLMMLSNATYNPLLTESEESRASDSKDEDRKISINFRATPVIERATKGLFECRDCNKVFNSHQALGGHRASHKKVNKGCFAAQTLEDSQAKKDVITHEEFFPTKQTSKRNSKVHECFHQKKKKKKVHECSICHRVFSSGQALGGHKRCHWITSNSPSLAKFHQFRDHLEPIRKKPNNLETLDLTLDLNLSTSTNAYKNGNMRPSIFGVSTEMHSKIRIEGKESDENNTRGIKNDNNITSDVSIEHNNAIDDEENSKLKLAKLCDLKEANMSENSSQWLQVGLGSTFDVGIDS